MTSIHRLKWKGVIKHDDGRITVEGEHGVKTVDLDGPVPNQTMDELPFDGSTIELAVTGWTLDRETGRRGILYKITVLEGRGPIQF